MSAKEPRLTEDHQIAWARLVRASERILLASEAALKAEGLPPLIWYDLLLELNRAAPEGLRPFQLQAQMLIPQYNMSRLIDRVVRERLVERLDCDEDGRGQVIRITPSGVALQKRMWPIYRGVLEREVGQRLKQSEASELADLLLPLTGRA